MNRNTFKQRTREEWNELYAEGNTPWNANEPDLHLVSLVSERKIAPCNVIDIGCGTGNESRYLAQEGFYVIGIDIAPKAIAEADALSKDVEGVLFKEVNFLELSVSASQFEFALDRRAFHFLTDEQVPLYVKKLATILSKEGKYLLIVSSEFEKGDTRQHYSKEDLLEIFSEYFDSLSIELVTLETHGEKPQSYVCLWQRNGVPVQ